MKALRVVCILALLSLLALSVPVAADEGPGVAEAPIGDDLHFIPVINNLPTGIEVMNLGATQTYIDVWYYDATGTAVHTEGPIKINGLSSRTIYPLPAAAAAGQSAVVVSYFGKTGTPTSPDDDEGYTTYGHDIAVTVNRFGSGGVPAATYTGIGRPLLPADDADGAHYAGQDTYWIYAPIIHKNNNTWNSTIWVQHAFMCDRYDICEGVFPDADVDVYFYEPDGGLPVASANLYIPAFASVALPSPATLADGVYSAWIRAHSPIAAAVDEYNSATLGDATGMFLSYRASPKNRWGVGSSAANFNFGPLIFSQYNGWEAGIAVLNTSGDQDADVVATFRAVDGTPLRTVHARLEERSDWLIYPLSNFGLPVDQVGSVSIEAQNYTPPGEGEVGTDNAIVAVVNQINETASMGSAYNAFRANFDPTDGDWAGLDTATYLAAPLMMKFNGGSTLTSGWSTGMVVMNTDLDSYLAERIELSFWDAAGGPVAVDTISINLRGGETHVVDLRYYYTGGSVFIPSGWVGSCTVESQIGEISPPIAAVVNEIYDAPAGAAQVAGDLFMTYEGYPLYATPTPEPTPTPGKCLDLDGIVVKCEGATGVADAVVAIRSSDEQVVEWTTTDSNGYFDFKDTDPCGFIEGVYFVSAQVVTDTDVSWQDLLWYNKFVDALVSDIELIDTDADGDIDADDLFYKTNMHQLNFVGVNCVTEPCVIATYTAEVYLDGDNDQSVDPGEEVAGATVVETGTGDWLNITIDGTTNASGIATLNIPAGNWDEDITALPFVCSRSSWPVACAGTPAYTVDMADCSAP